MKTALLIVLFTATANALTCYTCDQDTCQTTPRVEGCDPTTKCYTVTTKPGGVVLRKGCTKSCSYEASEGSDLDCKICDGDQCNDQAGNPPPPSENKPSPPPGIGGGAVPDAKPSSSFKSSILSSIFSFLLIIALF
ncbi:unnamed protein product, partial [Mesorhabditis belari]|uniref:Uncharacterized protein n=1 Tax=Mesorhabditis belari TaxID=2138241 RepID=A0AAF3JBN4_9BILA